MGVGITACVPGSAAHCVVVFVVLSVLDIFGECLWSIISGYTAKACRLSHACLIGVPLHTADIAAAVGG